MAASQTTFAADRSLVEMAPVVVTADRWEQSVDETPNRVTVITKEEIRALGPRDAGEALNRIVGVNLDSYADPFNVSFPSIQGAESYQIMVLINGIPLSDLSQRYAAISMIPTNLVERIEVVHGPAGSEWGSMLGGVINVITIKPDAEGNGTVRAGGGEHDTKLASANLRHTSDTFALAAGASYRDSAGPETNRHRGHLNTSGLATADIKLGDKTTLLVQGQTFQGKAGIGEYRGAWEGSWYEYRYENVGAGATLTTTLPVGALRLSVHRQDQTSYTEGFTLDEESYGAPRVHEQVNGGSAVWHLAVEDTGVTVGADASNGKLESEELDKSSYDYNPYGLFANVQHDLGALRLQGAVRFSDEDFFGDFTAYQLAALYRIGDTAILRASAGNGYTAPSLNSRYYSYEGWFVANPDLKVETVTQYQVGGKAWLTDELTIDANAFYAIVKDAISEVDAGNDTFTFKNFGEFRRQGLEAEIVWKNGPVSLAATALVMEVRDTNLDEVVEGKLRSSYGLFATYNDGMWMASLSGLWRDWNFSKDSGGTDKDWFWNAKAGYTYQMTDDRTLAIGVSVHNLTDVDLVSHEATPKSLPRTAEGYIEFSF